MIPKHDEAIPFSLETFWWKGKIFKEFFPASLSIPKYRWKISILDTWKYKEVSINSDRKKENKFEYVRSRFENLFFSCL